MGVIRVATAADVPRIVAMGADFIQGTGYASRLAVNPEAMTALVTRLVAGEGPGALASVVFLLERDGATVGMIGAVVLPHFMSGELIASELFWWVEPAARRGIGGVKLLAVAERWAKAHGATRMQMIAPTADVATFYERRGYEHVESAYQRSLT